MFGLIDRRTNVNLSRPSGSLWLNVDVQHHRVSERGLSDRAFEQLRREDVDIAAATRDARICVLVESPASTRSALDYQPPAEVGAAYYSYQARARDRHGLTDIRTEYNGVDCWMPVGRVAPIVRSGMWRMTEVTQSMRLEGFDWAGVEAAATDHIVRAVRTVRTEHAHEHLYGVIVHEFYGDGARTFWPLVTVGTEESLSRVVARYRAERPSAAWDWTAMLRWSGADLEYDTEGTDTEAEWATRFHEYATTVGDDHWQAAYDRFLRCFPVAVQRAFAVLRSAGDVNEEFVSVAMDEEGVLVPLSVSPTVLRKHFPDYHDE